MSRLQRVLEGGWPFPGPPLLGAVLPQQGLFPTHPAPFTSCSVPSSFFPIKPQKTAPVIAPCPSATWLQPWTAGEFRSDCPHSFSIKCGPPCSRESIMVAFKGVWTQAFWKAVTAEFLAMLIFVLLSVGSTINWGGSENPLPVDMVLISLCFGLSIATMVQCFGHISGGHINPAVTVAMVCTRKISIAKSVFYITAQCLGAIIGAGILYLVTPPSVVGGLGVTTVHGNLTAGHGLLVELIITFQLVFTIFASCDSKRTDVTGSVALAIGFSVAIGHLFAINYTGASMNPARSFGPAVIMGNWENHWIYWVGPIIGAVLAGALYEYVFCPDVELKRRLKEAFSKAAQQTKGSYMEVEDNRSQVETEDLILKPGVVHVIDIDRGDEKKGKDSSGEVLSSV
ncbi:aquaporin-4 isoform X2 [Rattus norvegicus]|uniref:Aquaporin-4 n=2 Tax=Rattus norvegicus TaxID=10116 RepID=A0A8L2UNG3_RAT